MLVSYNLNRLVEEFFTDKYLALCQAYDVEPMEIFYENVNNHAPKKEGFITLELVEGEASQVTLGDGVQSWRYYGSVMFSINRPYNEGSNKMRQHADILAEAGRKQTINGLVLYAPNFAKFNVRGHATRSLSLIHI